MCEGVLRWGCCKLSNVMGPAWAIVVQSSNSKSRLIRYREHLMPRALRRRKLSVQIWSHATATAAGMKETDFVSTEALEARMTLAEKHKQPPPHPASVLVVSKELRLLIRDLPFLSQSLDAQELKLKAWPGFFAPQSVLNPVPGKKQ